MERGPVDEARRKKPGVEPVSSPEEEGPGAGAPSAPAPDASGGAGEARAPEAQALDREAIKERVLEALKEVYDPELGINIVDLGLVYGVEVEGDTVHITYTLTTMGCPIGPLIEAQMRQLIGGIPGVEHVNAELVLRPPWTPEMMSEEAKAALGFW
ncbi:MAG TPA: metal-sulfur cluster assembly factor [Actinomycetota bacterium]|nr:metal-sulfur cluster assembly factor [Actinomycetota bacterium]